MNKKEIGCPHSSQTSIEPTPSNGYATQACRVCGRLNTKRFGWLTGVELKSKQLLIPSAYGTQYQEVSMSTVPKKQNCLLEANDIINGDRQDSYGNPEDSFAIISEYWTTYLRHKHNLRINLSSLDVANLMVLFKQARKLGQKHCRDNYIDSCGYEAIAADRLSKEDEEVYLYED